MTDKITKNISLKLVMIKHIGTQKQNLVTFFS